MHDEHFTMEHNGAFLLASPGFDAEIQAQNGNQQSGGSNDPILQNSGPVVAEEVDVNAVGSVPCWPNCVPQHVYDQLREITDAKDTGINGKVFYKSYDKTWSKLDTTQRNKAISFYHNLPAAKKTQFVKNAEDKTKNQTNEGTAPAGNNSAKPIQPQTRASEVIRLAWCFSMANIIFERTN